MTETKKTKPLKKELKLLDVYAIATGTTLSAGFFLLPGLAAVEAGSTLVLAYIIAALPMIPAMFSIIELSTAMPRAGGLYYFLDRTLGPYWGTIGGMGTWLALILKVSFALVGMGAYISLFIPGIEIIPVAIGLAILLGIVNVFGAKKSGRLQVLLVFGLLTILIAFITGGIPQISFAHFNDFLKLEFSSLLSTAGLVYISYVGITNVASLSEEVDNPEKNLPRGVILALGTALLVYVLGTAVMVGVVPMSELAGNLTPVATAAGYFLGEYGALLLSLAALLAFISVANAGTMSASRYPLAMSRDHLVPRIFRQLGKHGTPLVSIALTIGIIIVILLFLDPTGIAKLASAFQLLMFGLACFAVIIMRESHIRSYDPGYRSPFYPWMQIFGIIAPIFLIIQMGLLPALFTGGLILAGTIWYFYFARKRVARNGAIYHVFARLGKFRYDGLDTELRGILKEKGLRDEDPYDEIVMRSIVLDITEELSFEELVRLVSNKLTKVIPLPPDKITQQIMEGTRVGATPVTHGVALPHFRTDLIEHSEMLLVRSTTGISVPLYDPLTHKEEESKIVHALFFLISPEDNPSQHLRILAKIAGRVDDESFSKEWFNAADEQDIKDALLHDERFLSLHISTNTGSREMINKPLKQVFFPKGCLVAMLRRGGEILVPDGNTVVEEGDRLTIICDPDGMKEINQKYSR